MANPENIFRPGDSDNNLLRKILGELNDGLDISGGTINIPGNINATVVGGSLTSAGAVTVADGADVALGAKGDTFVTNPASSATLIGISKGILSYLNAIQTAEGFKTDAAVTNPASDATIIAALKGVLTADNTTNTNLGAVADAAVTNPASSASVIAALKGVLTADNTTNTNLGAVADAAVTNPASSASLIAATKGVLTAVNKIPSVGQAAAAASVPVVIASDQIAGLNNVGGYTVAIKDTTAVSTTPAYTAGDAVGGKRTITGALRTSNGSGILESIQILDRANQKAAMELFIFDSNPAAATITDNAAFVFSTDDLKVLAHVTIAATDYITINSKAVATIKGLGIALKGADSSTSLYAALVTTGTPTYAATTDVQLIYGILQD